MKIGSIKRKAGGSLLPLLMVVCFLCVSLVKNMSSTLEITGHDEMIHRATAEEEEFSSPIPAVEDPHYSSDASRNLEVYYKGYKEKSSVPWDGIENAQWCQETDLDPMPYDACRWSSFVFRFPVRGGLTNALHFLMKGAIWAFEEGVCFYVDEWEPEQSRLAKREPVEKSISPFLRRYFEPMGLPKEHKKIQQALKWHSVISPTYHQIQMHEFGKHSGGLTFYDNPVRHKKRDLEDLNMYNIDSIMLKKDFLRRFFRILPHFRQLACSRLAKHGLHDEYIALSIRRGDKVLEFELESDLQPYIDRAENAVMSHFNGILPMIFVASDDCSVMKELRDLRPNWDFVSECDHASEDNGFVITEMKYWSKEQTDRHYEKFITEMIAMASAKYFIGVSTTNVSYWIYFMRHAEAKDDTYVFVDTDQIPH